MVVTFFGHSDFTPSAEDHDRLMQILEEAIGENTVEFLLGGYGGFDAFAYRCCKEFKSLHKSAILTYVTPYLTEEIQKKKLQEISAQYDSILYPSLENVPPKAAISRRNENMVDYADIVIVYVERSYGGAAHALQRAEKAHKKIYHLCSERTRG